MILRPICLDLLKTSKIRRSFSDEKKPEDQIGLSFINWLLGTGSTFLSGTKMGALRPQGEAQGSASSAATAVRVFEAKKSPKIKSGFHSEIGSSGRARTADLVINSHPLYRLSYRGIKERVCY